MHLKSLELFGFKSFPSKAVLRFGPGITVVVGPNGCGKSNIFDAVKWALGEQSPKSLRGSKMEDIIFNGTDKYPSLNYTEVTLTFSNEDGYLPIDYKEVAITRRLYRSGESQYFINKNITRLKDIEELFMGTGIGESSYSFIEQGKVETLLSYRPEEKRLIFDEASGIIKYKEKKRETLRKLKDTEDNILRIDDIVSEVRRQTRYLERQVEKAKKYKEINRELIDTERKIAALDYRDLEKKSDLFLDEINKLKQSERANEEKITGITAQSQKLNSSLKGTQKNLEDINSQIISANSRIESCLSHIQINTQRQEEFTKRIFNLDTSLEGASQRIKLQFSRIDDEKKAILSLEEDFISLKKNLDESRDAKENKISQICEAKEFISSAKDSILHFEEEKVAVNNALIEIETHLKNLLAHKKRLNMDKARLDNYLEQNKENCSNIKGEVVQLQEEYDLLRKQKCSLYSQVKDLETAIEDLGRQELEKEKALVELKSYMEFLRDLKVKYEEFPVSRKVKIIFDKKPGKINKLIASLRDIEFSEFNRDGILEYEAEVEAKIISLPEAELSRRIDDISRDLNIIKSTVEADKERRGSFIEEISRQETVISEKESLLRGKVQEKENLNEEVKRFEDEYNLTEDELKSCSEEISDLEKKKQTHSEETVSLDNKLRDSKKNLREFQENLSLYSEEVNRLDIEMAKKEAQAKALGEHKESAVAKVYLLEEEKNNLKSSLNSLNKEKEETTLSLGSLGKEIISLEDKITQDKENARSLSAAKDELAVSLGIAERESASILEAVREAEKALENVRSRMYAKKLEVQKVNFEKAKIVDYLKQVYNIDFILEEISSFENSPDSLQENKERFKNKLLSLGAVNLVAIEEFQELNARYDFLNSQREDLNKSKDSLKKAIQKINRTSKEIFLEVFIKVEEEFKKYFRLLFGGGRAQLILLDKENVLDSGVEIEVQPPGKKLQIVSLLSGGEKALTAIALIFAIFKVKPSPLCVLDEIDAPLDESNVDRFNELLKEFSPMAQFIVITHNKRTMSRADVLYGVTMQEKGISKLVSVRFAEESAAA